MNLDLDGVAAFLVLCDEAHFGRAAVRLHLSPSALTRQVQHLEQQLGTRLVERGPGGYEGLTPAGERLRGAAPGLLEHVHAVGRATTAGAGVTVRVGLPGAVGDYPRKQLLDRLRAELWARRPAVRLRFLGIPLPVLDESLDRELVDVLWTIEHPVRRQHQTVLAAVERVGLVARGHRVLGDAAVDGRAFAELPLLRDPAVDPGWMAPWLLADLRPAQGARLVDVAARGVTDVLRAVSEGRAVTVVHAPQARHLPGSVRLVPLRDVGPVRYVAARRADDRRREVLDVITRMRAVAVRDASDARAAPLGTAGAR